MKSQCFLFFPGAYVSRLVPLMIATTTLLLQPSDAMHCNNLSLCYFHIMRLIPNAVLFPVSPGPLAQIVSAFGVSSFEYILYKMYVN